MVVVSSLYCRIALLSADHDSASAPSAHTANGTATEESATGISPPRPRGRVEYFARVNTLANKVEVPVATEKIDSDENEVIEKYAEWMTQEKNMDLSFEQFRSVFGFAKKG